jgi:hypothetical protein
MNTVNIVLPQAVLEHVHFCKGLYLARNKYIFDVIHFHYVRDWSFFV